MPFDFDAAVSAPFRMQPGLRRLADGASQLTPNVAPERGTACHLREKLAVLQTFASQALLSRAGFDDRPALDALAHHAAREHPQAFTIDAATWRAPILGWAVDPAGGVHELEPGRTPWPEAGECLLALPPRWRRAALLSLAFAEDFAIIDGNDGTIPWLAVALPSHWAPEHKVGRSFAEVHAPVADNRLITGTAAHLARLVTGSERWERFVWTIAHHPRLLPTPIGWTRHPGQRTSRATPWPQWPGGAPSARVSFRSEAGNKPCSRSMSKCSHWPRPSRTPQGPPVCTMPWRR